MAEFDARMAGGCAGDRADARRQVDKSLEGIRKILRTGMKMMVKLEASQRALTEAHAH